MIAVGEIRPYKEPWGVPMRVVSIVTPLTDELRPHVVAEPVGKSNAGRKLVYELADFERWYPVPEVRLWPYGARVPL